MPKTSKPIFQIVTLAAILIFQLLPSRLSLAAPRSAVENALKNSTVNISGRAADGEVKRYAILIRGWGDETYWWDHMKDIYLVLKNNYGYTDKTIYFFFSQGRLDPQVKNRFIVDGAATMSNVRGAFDELALMADADDEILLWAPGHGSGYDGPNSQDPSLYAHLSGFTSVDPGDEQDYLESEFKLKALYTDGVYGGDHGMDVWKLYYLPYGGDQVEVYRVKYVSHFENEEFVLEGTQSDSDPYIEKIVDYLEIDSDQDGMVSMDDLAATGEDGTPYFQRIYDPGGDYTETFDENDWGKLNTYNDDVRLESTYTPGLLVNAVIHDSNFDNHLDIDLNYKPGNPLEIDGTDVDNAGLFDGLIVNEDDDMNDWISIDDDIPLIDSRLTDDILDSYLDKLHVRSITVIISACYSGGFIWDISAPGRVIITNTGEEVYGYETAFSNAFVEALSTNAGEADVNGDAKVSMLEAFNYATSNDPYWCGNYHGPIDPDNPPDCEEPLYDDNGDQEGSTYFQLNSGGSLDGTFGANVYLK